MGLPGLLNKGLDRLCIGGRTLFLDDLPVEIRHTPGFCFRVIAKARDEMEVVMPGAFSKRDGIHPITAGQRPDDP